MMILFCCRKYEHILSEIILQKGSPMKKVKRKKRDSEVLEWFLRIFSGKKKYGPQRVIVTFVLLLPIMILEATKIAIYDTCFPNKMPIENMGSALTMPFFKVLNLKNTATFGIQGSMKPGFFVLFLLAWFILFVTSYILAEQNKRKSAAKDGSMEFGEAREFNKKFAYPQGQPGIDEPEENSYEPGNSIISQNLRYSLMQKNTNTSANTLVFGATRSGKSFTYVKPNILQMNTSYVVTDPKGELTMSCGKALMDHGYDVRVFNTAEPIYSCKYNPFHYIRDEQGVATLVNVFLDSTKNSNSDAGDDPFFALAEKNFYMALFYYVYYEYADQPEKQTLKSAYELFLDADEPEGTPRRGEKIENAFDKKFLALAKKNQFHPALQPYQIFKKGSPKTKQAILISVGVRMWFMSIPGVANMLSGDELNLEKLGDKKMALFLITKSEDSTFSFLVAMLTNQMFETLYYVGNTLNEKSWLLTHGNCTALRSRPFVAGTPSQEESYKELCELRDKYVNARIESEDENDEKFKTPDKDGLVPWPKHRLIARDGTVLAEYNSKAEAEYVQNACIKGEIKKGNKTLTSHVRVILDEFANIPKIREFEKKLATFASLRISADIIIQSINQLKQMYDNNEGGIISNCSIKILLGANDIEDCKFFSDLMGQTTVTSQSKNVSGKGTLGLASGGSLSESGQMLMRPEEIHAMDKDQSLILMNTTMPIKDKKYSAINHPRWSETYDDHNPDQIKNEFQYRRIFHIKQRQDALVRTTLDVNQIDASAPTGIASSASGFAAHSSIKDKIDEEIRMRKAEEQARKRITEERRPPHVYHQLTNHSEEEKELCRQKYEAYRSGAVKDYMEEKYAPLKDEKGRIDINHLPEDAKNQLLNAMKKNQLRLDENNTIKSGTSESVADAMAAIIDIM